MAEFKAAALCIVLTALCISPTFAQTKPVWQTPADAIAVLDTSGHQDFSYALVRDGSMRGHNTYYVTVGAHIGKLRVVAIRADGIVLSNGRVLLNTAVSAQPATLVGAAQAPPKP